MRARDPARPVPPFGLPHSGGVLVRRARRKAPPRRNGGDYPVIVWNIRLYAGITFRRSNFEREVNHEARSDRYR